MIQEESLVQSSYLSKRQELVKQYTPSFLQEGIIVQSHHICLPWLMLLIYILVSITLYYISSIKYVVAVCVIDSDPSVDNKSMFCHHKTSRSVRFTEIKAI